MNYTFLVGFLLYAVCVRAQQRWGVNSVFLALVVAIVPSVFSAILLGIAYGFDSLIANFFSPSEAATMVLRAIAACGIFYYLNEFEDTIGAWFFTVVCGVVVLFGLIPSIVLMIF